jgi:predicted kinase
MREPFRDFVAREVAPDSVLITCGLPATNKTETAEVIAALKGMALLRTDALRLEVLKGRDIFDEGTASDMSLRTLVYDRLFSEAEILARTGRGVILDATFITRDLRRRAAKVARRNGRILIIEETAAPEAFSLEKISRRSRESYESNALTPQAYFNNRDRFEPVDIADLKAREPGLVVMHFVVDTASDSGDGWFVVSRSGD